MRFGISFFPDCAPEQMQACDYYKQALDLCAYADELGYYSARIVEHYFHPYGGYSPSPITFLAAASQRTRSMRLVTGCVLPAFNHPLKLATELAMLDGLSAGRLDVGIARAFLPHEFQAFKIDMGESRLRFQEGIAALKLLWEEKLATFQGPFHSFDAVRCLPPVTQKPHPPIWIAVTQTVESFAWAGQQGYNLMSVVLLADFVALRERLDVYRQEYYTSKNTARSEMQIMLGYPLYIAETQQKAEELAERYLTHYLRTFAEAASGWDTLQVATYRNYQGMSAHIASMTFERILRESRALIGTPQRVIEQIEQIRQLFNVDYLSLQVFPCGMPYQEAAKQLRLFAEVIMPHFADKTVTAV